MWYYGWFVPVFQYCMSILWIKSEIEISPNCLICYNGLIVLTAEAILPSCYTLTQAHSINQISGSYGESGCLMASGLIWDADIVLLLPLIGSGGVQSNIHHWGSNMASEPVTGGCVLIQWTEVSCDPKIQWSFSEEDDRSLSNSLFVSAPYLVVKKRGTLWWIKWANLVNSTISVSTDETLSFKWGQVKPDTLQFSDLSEISHQKNSCVDSALRDLAWFQLIYWLPVMLFRFTAWSKQPTAETAARSRCSIRYWKCVASVHVQLRFAPASPKIWLEKILLSEISSQFKVKPRLDR